MAKKKLTHVDARGRVAMVDTSMKKVTARRAVASARVLMSPDTVLAVREQRNPKGDPLETARLAGIMAAKRTAELIPLCHTLPLTDIDVRAELQETGVYLEAEAATRAQTGVEMEALTAVATAGLALIDMIKAVDPGASVEAVRVLRKEGGKTGLWERTE